jgi:hypothetical protein
LRTSESTTVREAKSPSWETFSWQAWKANPSNTSSFDVGHQADVKKIYLGVDKVFPKRNILSREATSFTMISEIEEKFSF